VKTQLSTILLILTPLMGADNLAETISGISHSGQLRFGVIQTEDSQGDRSTTLSMGGTVTLETDPLAGISLVGSFFTTNPLFGKDEEGMFLGSHNQGYSILGESYLKIQWNKTLIKAGRQQIDTPYADSDDIGMVPNSFEGYSLINQDLKDTTLVLAWLDKYSGVDAPIPEKFNDLQASSDAVTTGGIIYEGVENTTLQAWHYDLKDANYNYAQLDYEADTFSMGLQYTDQDHDNTAYGLSLGGSVDNLSLGFAYNKVNGTVSNGFGGGPFFTSSEDHTIAEVQDQEAMRYEASYTFDHLSLAVSHLDLDIGENETDYLASFEINPNHSLDLIYSDMYDDGNMVRFFANYQF